MLLNSEQVTRLVTNNTYNPRSGSLPEHGSLVGAHGEARLEGARQVGAVVADGLGQVEHQEEDNKQHHGQGNPHSKEDILNVAHSFLSFWFHVLELLLRRGDVGHEHPTEDEPHDEASNVGPLVDVGQEPDS